MVAEVKDSSTAYRFRVGDWPMHGLLAIVRCHLRNMGLVLSTYEVSPVKWRILSILAEKGQCTIGQLAEISVVERSNLSRIVESMAQDGLINKVGQDRDKRQTVIAMTDKGSSLFAESLPDVLGYYDEFFRDVSEQDKAVFMKTLNTVERNVCGVGFKLVKKSGNLDTQVNR